MSHRSRIVSLLPLALLLATAPAQAVDGVILIDQNRALAGNVTPGDGPGFPITISVRGSYRLSSNLTVADANTSAIDIASAAGSVTIDLNGFSIIGPVTCTIGQLGNPTTCNGAADDPSDIFGPGTGIRSLVSDTLTVRNGSIVGMGRYALFQTGGANVLIDSVHVRENGRGGLWPSVAVIVHSTVSTNGGNGITINQGVIKQTLVIRNAENGIISTGQSINVQESQITLNAGVGIDFGATGLIGANVITSNFGGALTGSFEVSTNSVCSGTGCP